MNYDDSARRRIIGLTAVVAEYCHTLENMENSDRDTFVAAMLDSLPRIYWEFANIPEIVDNSLEFTYFPDYVDEDYYNSIRLRMEQLLGPDDTFLETFEEDMKYSDIPIAASISESLADIFQHLYNFLAASREADDDQVSAVFNECRENFRSYWGQTLVNVLRPLHHLRYSPQ